MRFSAVIAIGLLFTVSQQLCGQRIRFPQTPPNTGIPNTGVPNTGIPNTGIPNTGIPNTGIPNTGIPNTGFTTPQPGVSLGNPNLPGGMAPGGYDPFAMGNGISQPALPRFQQGYGQPNYGAPYGTQYGAPYSNPPYTGGPYGNGPYGSNPQQPQGIFGNQQFGNPYFRSNQDWLNSFEKGKYMRVIQEFHYRHTWLEGSESNEVDIHDAEVGFTLNWPNFLGSGEPLQLSPTFIFHFWDGPQPPSGSDLPSRAYSTFLGGSWTTPTNQNFGGEVLSSLGVYTDFNTFTSRSLRVKGTGLGWVRFTPNMLVKFGVSYLNRLDVKILPVGGLYWKPSETIELELAFPNPKIKFLLPQIGNTELRAYFTADYGGDSWTIQRFAGFSDQIDLIDLRVLGGIEFVGFRGFRGFFEGGYAFDRELLYRLDPASNIKLSDTVIVRAGFLF